MSPITTSTDEDSLFEMFFDWRTSELVVLCVGGPQNGQELGRFIVADVCLSFEKRTGINLLSQTARINMFVGAETRLAELEERRVLAFRRHSWQTLTINSLE